MVFQYRVNTENTFKDVLVPKLVEFYCKDINKLATQWQKCIDL